MGKRNEFIHARMHEFKTNLSSNVSALELGLYKGIILYRRKDKLGIFVLFKMPPYRPDRLDITSEGTRCSSCDQFL